MICTSCDLTGQNVSDRECLSCALSRQQAPEKPDICKPNFIFNQGIKLGICIHFFSKNVDCEVIKN
jgi:hypothetical protein